MEWNERKAKDALAAFAFGPDELFAAVDVFRSELEKGLAGDTSSTLQPLPSYLQLPTGDEQGEYIALDFGGTNVRVARIRLFGGGQYEKTACVARPLIIPGRYNHASSGETSAGLFSFIAEIVDAVMAGDHETPILLGHTFSFPMMQESAKDARLLSWTKELAVSNVEGEWINQRLAEAMNARGLVNVKPVAILNDTTAVMLAASYQWDNVAIGSIYATGFNACCVDTCAGNKHPMVINLEAGKFGWVDQNWYDLAVDRASEKPGTYQLEKAVSGKYLGALFSQALGEIMGEIFPAVTGEDLSKILRGEGEPLLKNLMKMPLTGEQLVAVGSLAEAIVWRSARFAAAVYVGILRHLSGGGPIGAKNIAIEGSVFLHMPLVRATIHAALEELLGEEAKQVQVWSVTGGASLGAAIAAAMADK